MRVIKNPNQRLVQPAIPMRVIKKIKPALGSAGYAYACNKKSKPALGSAGYAYACNFYESAINGPGCQNMEIKKHEHYEGRQKFDCL